MAFKRCVIFEITNCKRCPNCRTNHTPGTSYGIDYFCKLTYIKLKSYVESQREEPQDFEIPDTCPLPESGPCSNIELDRLALLHRQNQILSDLERSGKEDAKKRLDLANIRTILATRL